jgi:hypothetical protein
MKSRIDTELTSLPSWFQPVPNEHLIFAGKTSAQVANPLTGDTNEPECVVLTDRRLVSFGLVGAGAGGRTPAVTTIPLSQVMSIQATVLRWNAATVALCVLAFILYVIPGIVYIMHMERSKGPRVDVVAGTLRIEARFAPWSGDLLTRFHAQLQQSVLAARQAQP